MQETFATLFLVFALASAAGAEGLEQALARGDAAWERRAEGASGFQADPAAIGEALAAYEAALAATPESLEAHWKLMRALYFLGDYATQDPDRKLEIFTRGRDLSDAARELLHHRVGDPGLAKAPPERVAAALAGEPQAASVYFWSAVQWGLWGRHRGKLAAARQGVAGKIRDFAEITARLDEKLENGGGRRILGRLHAEAPKLPFVTGWIDRDAAVKELERAVELAPQDLLTRLFLAEALIEYHPERRDEGLAMLRRLVEQRPDPAYAVEDAKTLHDARALLERLEG